jgi:hypothetical protein
MLKHLFQIKKEKPTLEPKINRSRAVSVGITKEVTNFARNYSRDIDKLLNQTISSVDQARFRKSGVSEKQILLPSYITAYWFYESYAPVRIAVDFIGNTIQMLGYDIVDNKGQSREQVKKQLEYVIGSLDDYIFASSKQLTLYNMVIDYNISITDHFARFRLLPASNIYNTKISENTGNITSFSYKDEVTNNLLIERSNGGDFDNFCTVFQPDIRNTYIGTPPVLSANRLIDTFLLDNQIYTTFLNNGGYNNIMALLSHDVPKETADAIESLFRGLRSNDNAFKFALIENAIIDGESLVNFQTISQKLDNRLSDTEKQSIKMEVYSLFGIPLNLIEPTKTSGLGNESLVQSREIFNNNAIAPKVQYINKLANSYRVKIGLKILEENGYFKKCFENKTIQIETDYGVRPARASDFKFEINNYKTQSQTDLRRQGLEIAKITGEVPFDKLEQKERFWGVSASNIELERKLQDKEQNIEVYKQENQNTTKQLKFKKALKVKQNELYEYLLLNNRYSKTPEILGSKEAKELNTYWYNLLKKQAETNKPIAELVDFDYVNKNLAYFVNLSSTDAKNDVKRAGGDESKVKIDVALTASKLFLAYQLGLLTKASKEVKFGEETIKVDFKNGIFSFIVNGETINANVNSAYYPFFEGKILDETSKNKEETANNTDNPAIYLENINKTRAELISQQNIKRALITAKWEAYTAEVDKIPLTRWLHTRSAEPRDIHLRQVGQVKPIEEWSELPGQLPNCKCSLELVRYK